MPAEPDPISTPPAPPATAAPKASGRVIPHQASFVQRVAAFLITAVVKLIYATMRLRLHENSGAFEDADPLAAIGAKTY